MNGYGNNFSGQIFNRTQTRNHLRFNNQPCDIYSDLTASTIIPFDGGTRAKIFTIDKLWNRIIWFDKDQYDPYALNPQFTLTSPLSYYSLAYPTDITQGTIVVTNNNLNSCGFTGRDSTINLIIAELANNRISKVDYRIRTYMSNCQLQQLNKEYNIVDNTFTVIKNNCNFPYSLAFHSGNDPNSITDDLIWYSEGNFNTKRLNCIYANSGSDVPNHSITAIDFGRGFETIHPGRISVYKSPDGLKNVLSFVDEVRNSLVFLKLDQYGKINFTTGNYLIGEIKFGEEQKLQAMILTSNNNGLDGIIVWAVTNAPGGCGPICGSIHTLKINYIINTPINVEYLASYWKGTNSQNSFVNLTNLHAQNGYLDIFTMEKWDDNYGMRRLKPGVDIISDTYSGFCTNIHVMKITLRITNPCKIQFDEPQYKSGISGSSWENLPNTFINGVVYSSFQYINSGTSILTIYSPNVPNAGDHSEDAKVKISFQISPQDENPSTSIYKIKKEYIATVSSCTQVGGCPFVFVKDGNDFKQDNNILHRSEFENNISKDIEDKYILRVNPTLNPVDSTCEFKIKELNNDISHFDNFKLVSIDHPSETILGITENNNYVLYFPSITESPEHAEYNENDVTQQLNYDSNFTKTVSGKTDDNITGNFSSNNKNSLQKKNMFNAILNSIRGVNYAISKNNLNSEHKNFHIINDSNFADSIAIIMDPSANDAPSIIGNPVKRPAGTISAYDFEEDYAVENILFARRQNTSPVIVTVGRDVIVDSISAIWNTDFKLSYAAITPVYYGGYIENELDFVEATDSLNGDVLSYLTDIDENYAVMDSTTNIALKFKNNLGGVESGFIRDYVLIINGRYENVREGERPLTNTPENLGQPISYRLLQNYPNPFNPITKINFDLPNDGKVNLVVYDILGKEIMKLVNNEFKNTGRFSVEFNGTKFASGIYFYRIEAGKYVQTRRMVLIK